MATFKKKQLDELVGGDMFSSGGDRNQVNNSFIWWDFFWGDI